MLDWICTPFSVEEIEEWKNLGCTTIRIGDDFFASRLVKPMKLDEIKQAITFCETLQLKVQLLVNRIFMEDELDALHEYLQYFSTTSVTGFVYMDPAVWMIANELKMTDRLIYHPDTLMTSWQDGKMMLDKHIQRISLASEITKEEVEEITRQLPEGSFEIAIHGRQVMSYSRRFLVSDYLQEINRSQLNPRGKRDLVLIESTRQGRMPILEDEQGTHIFTEGTLCSFSEIQSFVDWGITHFVLDGIFSCKQELQEALQAYQAILQGSEPQAVLSYFEKRWPEHHYDSGYWYRKTNLIKGD